MQACTFAEWAEAQSMSAYTVAAYVEGLHRRISILESVIAENLDFEDLDEAGMEVLSAILEDRSGPEQH